jgi:hypothetical protein
MKLLLKKILALRIRRHRTKVISEVRIWPAEDTRRRIIYTGYAYQLAEFGGTFYCCSPNVRVESLGGQVKCHCRLGSINHGGRCFLFRSHSIY